MITETQIGSQTLAYGARPVLRTDRSAAVVTTDAHARYQEAVLNGNVFGLSLLLATTSPYYIQAGNVVGTAANAITQFAVWNPVSSGVNLVLWQFNLGYISGTPTAGPTWHGLFNAQAVTNPTTIKTGIATAYSAYAKNLGGFPNTPRASYVCVPDNTFTFAGNVAPYLISMANFSSTATSQSVSYPVQTTDLIDGKIVLPSGTGWVPLLPGPSGSSVLVGMSVIWEEIPA